MFPRASQGSLVGARLSRYEITALIGSGWEGCVYRARDAHTGHEVALRVFSAPILGDPTIKRSLADEASRLARLNHPNVATVYEVDTQAGVDFMAGEFVPGITLDILLRDGPLGAAEVLRLGQKIAAGLEAAHAWNLVHGRLKPSAIKLTPDGQVKILDFGLGSLALRRYEPSVAYTSPERLRGHAAGARGDVFSAGALLYAMATGHPPFAHREAGLLVDAVLLRDPPPPTAIAPLLPLQLERVILRALSKQPAARQQSAGELASDLRWVGRLETGARPVGKRPLRWWWLLAGAPRSLMSHESGVANHKSRMD